MSGRAETARFNIRANACEKICRIVADTWTELLTKKNGGLTRDDVTFIMQQVEGYTTSHAKTLSDVGLQGSWSNCVRYNWLLNRTRSLREDGVRI